MGKRIWGDREDEMEQERRGSGSRGRRLLVVAVTADLRWTSWRARADDGAVTVEVGECEGPLARKSRLRTFWVVPGLKGEAIVFKPMVERVWPMLATYVQKRMYVVRRGV